MNDENKTQAQLIEEVMELRRSATEGHDKLNCLSCEELCSGEDMTGSEQVRKKLLAAEERYREIFENAIEGIYRSTPEGQFIEINAAFARILGYDTPEEVKRKIENIGQQAYVDPEKRKEWTCEAAKKDFGSFEVQIRRKDGSTRWVLNKACVIRNERGNPVYFDGFIEDITERKFTEEKLRAAEEKYRGIYENAVEGIFRTTPAGRVLDANPAFARIFGFDSPEEMKSAITDIGQQLYVEPAARKEWIAFIDQKEYGRFEVQMHNRTGNVIWVSLSARPGCNAEGKTLYYEGFAEDITQRKRAEQELKQYHDNLEELVKERTLQLEKRNQQLISEIEEREKAEKALRESEMHYRALFSNAGVAIANIDAQGKNIGFNDSFVEFTGYTREELESMSGADITHPEYIERTECLKAKQRSGEIDQFAMEKCYICKDGTLRWGELRATPIRDEQGGFLSAVLAITDITERKRAEEALAKNEMLYRNLFENAPIGMFQSTFKEGRFLHVNSAYAKMLGYASPDDLMVNVTDVAALHVNPEDRETLLGTLEQQDWFYSEYPRFRKDGSIMIGKVAIRRVLNPDGTVDYIEGIVEDITERKRAEKALLESEKELRVKAQNLMEVNTTMNVLLRTMEKDQEELKERFLTNVAQQVLPYLDKLEKTKLDTVQRGFIRMAKSHMDGIASPFVQKLTSSYLNFTKKEIQIAVLIKEGKTTKEIAELMNSSQRVIEFHRENIRAKLGIKNKKGNLQILLRSFA